MKRRLWTAQERETLLLLRNTGRTLSECGRILNRTKDACWAQLLLARERDDDCEGGKVIRESDAQAARRIKLYGSERYA